MISSKNLNIQLDDSDSCLLWYILLLLSDKLLIFLFPIYKTLKNASLFLAFPLLSCVFTGCSIIIKGLLKVMGYKYLLNQNITLCFNTIIT